MVESLGSSRNFATFRPRQTAHLPMEGSTLPLAIAAGVFFAMVVWRVRPAIGFGRRPGVSKEALRGHLARAEAAKDEHERALALCDAADLMAAGGARGLYLRALRADPGAVQVVQRAVTGLAKRPRALEHVLWRHLSQSPWVPAREATVASLDALRILYEGPLRKSIRAKFFAHARDALRG
jgi:hypothetical protein